MGGGQMETPARRVAQPGQKSRCENAAGKPEIARAKASRQKHGTLYCVTATGGDTFTICVKGRVRWALNRLREAGANGCTPIAEPAPRWSAYVFDLRDMGVEIETIHEAHGGDFAGHHGRYVLRATVTLTTGGAE